MRSGLTMVLLLSAAARGEIVERIAAVVNGQPIALGDVRERAAAELARLEAQPRTPEREKQRQEIIRRALEQMVDERLIESEAATLGIEIPEEDQNRSVEALAKQNSLTVAQFKEALAGQNVDFATVKDSLRRQALRFRLLQAKVKQRKITDEEIKAAYAAIAATPEQEMRARHIFFRVPPKATAAELDAIVARARKAMERIAAGEEFAVVARDLSDGPTAKQGGDLGWFRRGMLMPELEGAAARLEPGQHSPLLRATTGLHVIKVESKRPLPVKPLSEMQDEIRARLGNEAVLKEQDRFLSQLRKGAQVDIKP